MLPVNVTGAKMAKNGLKVSVGVAVVFDEGFAIVGFADGIRVEGFADGIRVEGFVGAPVGALVGPGEGLF